MKRSAFALGSLFLAACSGNAVSPLATAQRRDGLGTEVICEQGCTGGGPSPTPVPSPTLRLVNTSNATEVYYGQEFISAATYSASEVVFTARDYPAVSQETPCNGGKEAESASIYGHTVAASSNYYATVSGPTVNGYIQVVNTTVTISLNGITQSGQLNDSGRRYLEDAGGTPGIVIAALAVVGAILAILAIPLELSVGMVALLIALFVAAAGLGNAISSSNNGSPC